MTHSLTGRPLRDLDIRQRWLYLLGLTSQRHQKRSVIFPFRFICESLRPLDEEWGFSGTRREEWESDIAEREGEETDMLANRKRFQKGVIGGVREERKQEKGGAGRRIGWQ